ncbi:MAG: glutathione synthetase [Saprospiraceae bacterium]|nr:glutathione synthetase [Saprospiraceae bacterium]
MMMSYRILVLTDHSGHSDQNSIYAILNQMKDHPRCQSIDVVSRGLEENRSFFDDMQIDSLLGVSVTNEFRYSKTGNSFKTSLSKLLVKDYDIVLLRLPRPISDEFLNWISEVLSHTYIINNPKGIIKTSNKKYLVNFPEICPDVRLCHSIKEIKEELAKYPIVLKPLKEYGGRGLLMIEDDTINDGNNEYDTHDYLAAIEGKIIKDGYLSMRYLRNVRQGDKRIIVVGGVIMAASLRLPKEGNWLCNVSQGGKSVASKVTAREQEIIDQLNPILESEGIFIYGVDTLVDDNGERVLSEINTLSIGGFPQAEVQSGKPIIKKLIDKIFEHADQRT